MTVSEKINQFIAENGGNEKEALNVALSKLERIEYFIQAPIGRQLPLCVEANEFHISKDVYGAAAMGFRIAIEHVEMIINTQ